MRSAIATICLLALIFGSNAAVTPAACNPAVANADKCDSANSNAVLSCLTGFAVLKTLSTANPPVATYSCVAVDPSCPTFGAPLSTVTGSNTYTPVVNTCAATANAVDGVYGITAAPAAVACANTNSMDVTKKTYTASTAVTAAVAANNGPFMAMPTNSWNCWGCPAGCANCDPTSAATAAQTKCKTAQTGYFLSGDADGATGLKQVCASAVTATYGGNSSACTACSSATNCTTGTCVAPNVYINVASVAGYTSYTIGNTTYNLSALPAAQQSLVGCFNPTNLAGYVVTPTNTSGNGSTNGTNGTNGTNTTTSGARMSFGIVATISAVAAAFAF